MAKKAAIYARVSRAYKDEDDRVTIKAQLEDADAYCQERGYIVVARYVDKDKYKARRKFVSPSGTRKDRPAYLDMLKAAEAGEFDVIVAWKEDRLYRGMYAALPLVEVLDECRNNLAVELVKETFDRSMLEIKAAIAKIELDNIRDRMLMGRRVRLERGEVPGGEVRYGYEKSDTRRLIANEAEAEVVRQVFEWYNQGKNNLTFEGYATGEYPVNLDGETFTIPCPPIITLCIWHKAQEMRQSNKSYRGRNVKEDYLCRGMVICPCGWKWGARTCHSQGQTGKCGYYACARHGHQPEQVHPDCPGTIGSKKLDDEVWRFVVTICENPAIVQQAIDEKIAELEAERGDIEAEAEQLQHELDNVAKERQWVITQARKGGITEEDMGMQLAALEYQALDLRRKREDKLATIAVQQQADYLKEWVDEYLSGIKRGLRILETDVGDLNEEERDNLRAALEAGRFLDKFHGDGLAALRWAILEEKRRTVRALVSDVLVVKGENGEKIIVPHLALKIPREYASLAYSDQSLEYVESLGGALA